MSRVAFLCRNLFIRIYYLHICLFMIYFFKGGDLMSQSRKFMFTINNPLEGQVFPKKGIEEILYKCKNLRYFCKSDEIGEQGTYHIHVYVVFTSAVRFSTMKKRFPRAHFENKVNGSSQQVKDYIFKEGKFENSEKEETNIKNTHVEYGDMPIEMQGARTDLEILYDMIKKGCSDYEIIHANPSYLLQIDKFDKIRNVIRQEEQRDKFRHVHVSYVFGETGTGKSRNLFEKYGSSCYRVTNYIHPFDGYRGEKIIVFEEFRSSLRIQDMLNYLDGYPLYLPSRYNDKIACFEEVYINTNIPLEMQYLSVQKEFVETWYAFLRRINVVKFYSKEKILRYSIDEYLNLDFKPTICNENVFCENSSKCKEIQGTLL